MRRMGACIWADVLHHYEMAAFFLRCTCVCQAILKEEEEAQQLELEREDQEDEGGELAYPHAPRTWVATNCFRKIEIEYRVRLE